MPQSRQIRYRPPSSPDPAPEAPAARVAKDTASRIGKLLLWVATAFFLLQAVFHFLGLEQVNRQLAEEQRKWKIAQKEEADWKQRAHYAQSPAFLDEAVKEFTLTRDADETVIVVEPSPVPPGREIRQ